VNVTKEIGKFYQNKKQWNTAIGYYEKSNAKSMDIDMETNLLLLQSYTEAKEFEKAVKKRWIWWMFFLAASVLLLFRFSIQSIGTI
jgi:hypothetical protein